MKQYTIYQVTKRVHMDMHPTEYEPEFYADEEEANRVAQEFYDPQWGQSASVKPVILNA